MTAIAQTRATTMETAGAWVKLFRLPFHSASMVPFVLGNVLAWSAGYPFSWAIFSIGALGVFLITSTCYLTNEYFDFETDAMNRAFNQFSGGSRVLPDERVPRRQALRAAALAAALAIPVGLFLQFYLQTGPLTMLFGITGLLAAYFYTAKPVQLAYRGFGEITIGLMYGWLTVLTGFYLQAHSVSYLPLVVGAPWMMGVILLIWINEFPDYESDLASNKLNLVVRMGVDRAAIVHNGLIAAMWALLVPVTRLGLPTASLLLLVPVVALSAVNFVGALRKDYREPKKLEGLCLRTIAYAVMLPAVFATMFLWKGLAG